jgi:hypothetical protein
MTNDLMSCEFVKKSYTAQISTKRAGRELEAATHLILVVGRRLDGDLADRGIGVDETWNKLCDCVQRRFQYLLRNMPDKFV